MVPGTEKLLIDLGLTVSKAVFRVWTKDSGVQQDVGLQLADMASLKLSGLLERRRANTAFEGLADLVAARLVKLLDLEFGLLADNEIAAAILLVDLCLANTDLSDELLFSVDLEAVELEKRVRSASAWRIHNAQLSMNTSPLFDLILGEACAYITAVTTRLPDFNSRAAVESLRRDTALSDLLTELIRRLPEPTLTADATDQDAAFERRYLLAVTNRLDRLELFGLDVSPASKRYRLTVAYISLTASIRTLDASGLRGSIDEVDDAAQAADSVTSDDPDDDSLRVEHVLAGAQRLMLRGEAGLGKSTLLQWIAIRAAQKEFENELESWNGRIPFLINLRNYVGKDLPTPNDFVDSVSRSFHDFMPAAWVHRVLDADNALVLVDGVDELPDNQRSAAYRWVESLVADYPRAFIVITSRPAAVGHDWLADMGFTEAELQPMSVSDIVTFVEHWYDAAAEGSEGGDTEKQQEIDALAEKLVAVIVQNRPIRSLATTPLLCAMLCALNRDRRSQLPKDRLELYRISLEMLLERRDSEREVADPLLVLTLPEKLLLFQELAQWLMMNGLSEADRPAVVRCFERRLAGMPSQRSLDGEFVYRGLLVRSGIIREPSEGRVSFIHRTFQEYLAAKEAVESDNIGMLLGHATEDQWLEVIVLAAGHARAGESDALIRGLVRRGSSEPENLHRLHLLAVACLETAREVSPELRDEIANILHALVPPRDMADARALASAGDLVVDALAGFYGIEKYASVVAATVRALGLIGTPKALDALVAFADDRRVTVARELIRARNSFNRDEYADRVLSHSILNRGSLTLKDPAETQALTRLPNLQSVHVKVPRYARNLDYLLPLADRVTTISASGTFLLEDISAVQDCTELGVLELYSCSTLERLFVPQSEMPVNVIASYCDSLNDLTPLIGSHIRSLALIQCHGIADFSFLSGLPSCETLDLERSNVRSLEVLAGMASLRAVDVSATGVSDLTPLSELQFLRGIDANACSDLMSIPRLDSDALRSISILESGGSDGLDVSGVAGCQNLVQFLGSMILDLEPFGGLQGLRVLAISGLMSPRLEPLLGCRELRSLNLDSSTHPLDIALIAQLPQLQLLWVVGSPLLNVDQLVEIQTLTSLIVDTEVDADLLEPLRARGVFVQRRRGASLQRANHFIRQSRLWV